MKHEQYETVYVSKDFLEFEFISTGPKGEIIKIIQFTKMDNEHVYNLSFGNRKKNGEIDDYSINDNKDRNKILATVVATIYTFTSVYPDKYVAFRGNTPEKTRLYRMAISLNLDELGNNFEIYGLFVSLISWKLEQFEKGKEYDGFLIKRK